MKKLILYSSALFMLATATANAGTLIINAGPVVAAPAPVYVEPAPVYPSEVYYHRGHRRDDWRYWEFRHDWEAHHPHERWDDHFYRR